MSTMDKQRGNWKRQVARMMDVDDMDDTSSCVDSNVDDCPFPLSHNDVITHVALDNTGRRLTTCSTDKTMAVWDRKPDGRWNRTACWKVHGGVVWRSVWAHPEFGQVIATCSGDRSVHIWEQIHVPGGSHGKWVRKAYLTDSRNGVTDIVFSPRHLGLMLATVSVQGVVRVYEAADVMDLSRWSMIHELQAFHTRCGSVAWSNSQIHRPLLVVGSDDANSNREERLVVYELNDQLRKFKRVQSIKTDFPCPVSDIHFNPVPVDNGHQLAITAGDVFVFTIKVPHSSFIDDDSNRTPTTDAEEYVCNNVTVLGVGDNKKAWRVRYNLTGNVLVASCGDGTVRIWKSMFLNQWSLLTEMTAETYIDEEDEDHLKADLMCASRHSRAYY